MSDFVKANQLFNSGKFKEAEDLYRRLYNETGLEIYKFGLEYAISKQKRDLSSIQGYQSQYDNFKNRGDNILAGDKNKRILFITAGLKGPTPGGGIATCFHSMVKTMGQLSTIETDVIYIAHPYYSKGNYDVWKKIYKDECNANLLAININEKNYGSKEMKRSYAILEFLSENHLKYDSVVFHDFMGLAYYSLLAKKMGLAFENLKIVISAHGNHLLSNFFGKKKVDSWDVKAIIFMERMSLYYADEITSPSYFYKDWLSDNLGVDSNKIKVLPNIIYRDKSKRMIDIEFRDKSKKLIVFYGRIERLKGIDILIEAIKRFNQHQVKQNVLIAGVSTKIDGMNAKDYILKGLEGLGCEVLFEFNCQPVEVFNYINHHDGVCVLPTLGENAPCVVVECILHGVRFIASDIPGIKEIVGFDHHKKYLFKTGSVDALVEKFSCEIETPTQDALSYSMRDNEKNWISFLSNKYNQLVRLDRKVAYAGIKEPFISVVIPTSDRPELLKLAIQSIKKQTYKNYEIIVVDDNSIESKANEELARSCGCNYIYLLNKSYKGGACNIGASYANGEYICFFDDDDIADRYMLERYMIAYNNIDADILSGCCDVFEHSAVATSSIEKIPTNYKSLALGGGLEVNLSINMFGKGSFIVKKSLFDEIGGYELDNSAVPTVDYRFYIKAALKNAKIFIIPYSQYYYRRNSPKSLFYVSGNSREQKFLAKISIQKIFEDNLGRDLAMAIAPMIWNISLPVFD